MEQIIKQKIYKLMIEYILETTNYNLKSIASFSNTSIKKIRQIYSHNEIPNDFDSELQLVKLFEIILEINTTQSRQTNFLVEVSYEYARY